MRLRPPSRESKENTGRGLSPVRSLTIKRQRFLPPSITTWTICNPLYLPIRLVESSMLTCPAPCVTSLALAVSSMISATGTSFGSAIPMSSPISSGRTDSFDRSGSTALFAGGLAAILASTCCLGPLILLSLGFSGAWIGNLTVLEPYRPFFIVAAFVALFFAGRQIFRPAQLCNPGEVCALPRARRIYKFLFWSCTILVLVALTYPYVARFFY